MAKQINAVGSCHCQSIRFRVASMIEELTSCNCSMCSRRATTMLKVHESEFELLQGADKITEYQFHTNTAIHCFCKVCGIYPFHRKRVTPDYLGINIHCLEDVDLSGLAVRETHGADMD